MKASDIEPDKNVSILMKSDPGLGKTIAACSFAIFGDVYLAYFDKRVPIEVLTFFKRYRPDLLERIHYDSYSAPNCHEFYNWLVRQQKNPGQYAAIIVDSVTNFTSAAVNWSLFEKKLTKSDEMFLPQFDEYKVETSMITQCLDMCKSQPWFNIWTAHPLPKLDIKGSSRSMSVTTSQSLVSYGNKVGALIPGQFMEIYHFGRTYDGKRFIYTDMVGNDFAKTSLNLPKQFDITVNSPTDQLFAEKWRDAVNTSMGLLMEKKVEVPNGTVVNPFAKTYPWSSK